MSVFDGEIDFQSVYMVDYAKKMKPKSPRRKAIDDDCLVVGLGRDSLKAKDARGRCPDVLCPITFEYYKDAVNRFKEDHPKLTEIYMTKDLDPTPIDHEIQDLKRTEYLTKYCSRELPFMSVNLTRRARALQTLRLPDDIAIPDTTQQGSYRRPAPDKYTERPSKMSMRPKFDPSLQSKFILTVHSHVSRPQRLRTLITGEDRAAGAVASRAGAVVRLPRPAIGSKGILSKALSSALIGTTKCSRYKTLNALIDTLTVLTEELRRILRINTGETTYGVTHGLLGKVVLDRHPFGEPRQEPKYGRWRNPYIYTYRL